MVPTRHLRNTLPDVTYGVYTSNETDTIQITAFEFDNYLSNSHRNDTTYNVRIKW